MKSYVLEEPEIKWSKNLREAKCEKNKVVESRGYEIFREVVLWDSQNIFNEDMTRF